MKIIQTCDGEVAFYKVKITRAKAQTGRKRESSTVGRTRASKED